jgi:proliferating cell nuclear antigen
MWVKYSLNIKKNRKLKNEFKDYNGMDNIMQSEESNNVLLIKTVQIAPFRTLMTALKDILVETNITFQSSGIRIVNMDKSHTILVHLFLNAENFESFFCKHSKIIIGVNMFHLFKLINSIDNNDTLTFFIENDHYSDGVVKYLGMKFENGNIMQCKTQYLRLIEPDNEELDVPNVSFSSVINIPSTDFQKIVRDMSSLSERLEIKCVGDELIFSLSGPFAKVQIRRSECNGNMKYIQKHDSSQVIQGEFPLKYLSYFIKCTNLCNSIELMLENDLPLIVKYNVASLGEIKLCLAPLPPSNII